MEDSPSLLRPNIDHTCAHPVPMLGQMMLENTARYFDIDVITHSSGRSRRKCEEEFEPRAVGFCWRHPCRWDRLLPRHLSRFGEVALVPKLHRVCLRIVEFEKVRRRGGLIADCLPQEGISRTGFATKQTYWGVTDVGGSDVGSRSYDSAGTMDHP